MSWANSYIKQLKENNIVKFRPRGNSMSGKIFSGQLCTVEPVKNYEDLVKGDIVLCKVSGNQYLHLISAISGDQFQISNNHGRINGWTNQKNIFGKLIKVEN